VEIIVELIYDYVRDTGCREKSGIVEDIVTRFVEWKMESEEGYTYAGAFDVPGLVRDIRDMYKESNSEPGESVHYSNSMRKFLNLVNHESLYEAIYRLKEKNLLHVEEKNDILEKYCIECDNTLKSCMKRESCERRIFPGRLLKSFKQNKARHIYVPAAKLSERKV